MSKKVTKKGKAAGKKWKGYREVPMQLKYYMGQTFVVHVDFCNTLQYFLNPKLPVEQLCQPYRNLFLDFLSNVHQF